MSTQLFISWSGSLSQKVAVVLHGWIPSVLQTVEPFLSSEDIEKGERWSDHVAEKLENCGFGIVVLTEENLSAPWILFESGALSKMVSSSRVAPLLVDVGRVDIRLPLSQFQSVLINKAEIHRLVLAINKVGPTPVNETALSRSFEALWPEFEKLSSEIVATEKINRISTADKTTPAINDSEAIRVAVGELAQSVQSLRDDFRNISNNTRSPAAYRPRISPGAIRDLDNALDLLITLRPENSKSGTDTDNIIWENVLERLTKVQDYLKFLVSRERTRVDGADNYLNKALVGDAKE